ncbi:MAG: hypothetical protein KIH08_11715 [Candidatus Freyarchaeota archaeon]|nr:hypothetical protein [Candidatus Jordarchaeia archaeon]MBS7267468.1 hypothetical protein [Candidatus Jordarchaeia archaeon]MBS7279373.1 hypothetical protein [Candidatus Jordarchaeia archaeon]
MKERKEPSHKTSSPEKSKRPVPRWEEIAEHVYGRLDWYATRFIIFSVIGMVIGVAGLVYGILAYYFLVNPLTTINPVTVTLYYQINPLLISTLKPSGLQETSVFLGVFIGVGSLVASLVLLAWGIFWRKIVDARSIF